MIDLERAIPPDLISGLLLPWLLNASGMLTFEIPRSREATVFVVSLPDCDLQFDSFRCTKLLQP